MSPVDLKKWQCPLSIFFINLPVDFEIVQCRLSILRNDNVPCRYFSNVPVDFKVVKCRLSILRKRRVTLSNLRVKATMAVELVDTIGNKLLTNENQEHPALD